jgi:hypothetical protein
LERTIQVTPQKAGYGKTRPGKRQQRYNNLAGNIKRGEITMAGRHKDFITYPGSGMWMLCGNNKDGNDLQLYPHLSVDQIKQIAADTRFQLYWIDTGIGAANLLSVRKGRMSASASKITPQLLNRYLGRK